MLSVHFNDSIISSAKCASFDEAPTKNMADPLEFVRVLQPPQGAG